MFITITIPCRFSASSRDKYSGYVMNWVKHRTGNVFHNCCMLQCHRLLRVWSEKYSFIPKRSQLIVYLSTKCLRHRADTASSLNAELKDSSDVAVAAAAAAVMCRRALCVWLADNVKQCKKLISFVAVWSLCSAAAPAR